MVAYVVGRMTIHDPATYRKYAELTPGLVKKHGGRFLTRGGDVTTLEGEKVEQRMVILEFPDKTTVHAFFDDPEYQAAAEFRRAAATSTVVVQEGPSNSENPAANV